MKTKFLLKDSILFPFSLQFSYFLRCVTDNTYIRSTLVGTFLTLENESHRSTLFTVLSYRFRAQVHYQFTKIIRNFHASIGCLIDNTVSHQCDKSENSQSKRALLHKIQSFFVYIHRCISYRHFFFLKTLMQLFFPFFLSA